MNLREAAILARNIRMNGLDDVKQEDIKGAMAVLEQLAEREKYVTTCVRAWTEMTTAQKPIETAVFAISDFKIGGE